MKKKFKGLMSESNTNTLLVVGILVLILLFGTGLVYSLSKITPWQWAIVIIVIGYLVINRRKK